MAGAAVAASMPTSFHPSRAVGPTSTVGGGEREEKVQQDEGATLGSTRFDAEGEDGAAKNRGCRK